MYRSICFVACGLDAARGSAPPQGSFPALSEQTLSLSKVVVFRPVRVRCDYSSSFNSPHMIARVKTCFDFGRQLTSCHFSTSGDAEVGVETGLGFTRYSYVFSNHGGSPIRLAVHNSVDNAGMFEHAIDHFARTCSFSKVDSKEPNKLLPQRA